MRHASGGQAMPADFTMAAECRYCACMLEQSLPCAVALTACPSHDATAVSRAVGQVLDASRWTPPRGRVLVKPNLLRAVPLACTHPAVTAAACRWLMDCGARPLVADSPGFGTARGVAAAIGLEDALKPLGLKVHALDGPVPVPLRGGGSWGVSRMALEAEAILSIPRVKAHTQVRVTLAVKNLFGCICGLGKVMAHARQGETLTCFTDGVADLLLALPPAAGLADGVTAMHGTGPSGGQPFPLGCIGASSSAAALDVALCRMLGLKPETSPIWDALCRAGVAQALAEPTYPLRRPEEFATEGFRLPAELAEISFRPRRLLWSVLRRCWRSWVS